MPLQKLFDIIGLLLDSGIFYIHVRLCIYKIKRWAFKDMIVGRENGKHKKVGFQGHDNRQGIRKHKIGIVLLP